MISDDTSYFEKRLVNRMESPTHHILICEDDIQNQAAIFNNLSSFLKPQGQIEVSCVSGALAAKGVIENVKVDLILLDYDMPNGNGYDLMFWLKIGKQIPVIGISGIQENNTRLLSLGAVDVCSKDDLISGKKNDLILSKCLN